MQRPEQHLVTYSKILFSKKRSKRGTLIFFVEPLSRKANKRNRDFEMIENRNLLVFTKPQTTRIFDASNPINELPLFSLYYRLEEHTVIN